MSELNKEYIEALHDMNLRADFIEEAEKKIKKIHEGCYDVHDVEYYERTIYESKRQMAYIYKTQIKDHIEKNKEFMLSAIKNIDYLNDFVSSVNKHYDNSQEYYFFNRIYGEIISEIAIENKRIKSIYGRPLGHPFYSAKEAEILYAFLKDESELNKYMENHKI
jgi:uncharacterized protein YabN with tetrapyrrole methylase and pyrophosphatase domain